MPIAKALNSRDERLKRIINSTRNGRSGYAYMQIITLTGKIDADGHLRLDVPTSFTSGDVEVEITIHSIQSEYNSAATYDFSDLAGTLSWQGDPVIAQRNLRDEW